MIGDENENNDLKDINKNQIGASSSATLKPKIQSLEKTIEEGTEDELKQVLHNYKKISNSSEMLEKTVVSGNAEKLKILLDYGVEFPEETDCFFLQLLTADRPGHGHIDSW